MKIFDFLLGAIGLKRVIVFDLRETKTADGRRMLTASLPVMSIVAISKGERLSLSSKRNG